MFTADSIDVNNLERGRHGGTFGRPSNITQFVR